MSDPDRIVDDPAMLGEAIAEGEAAEGGAPAALPSADGTPWWDRLMNTDPNPHIDSDSLEAVKLGWRYSSRYLRRAMGKITSAGGTAAEDIVLAIVAAVGGLYGRESATDPRQGADRERGPGDDLPPP